MKRLIILFLALYGLSTAGLAQTNDPKFGTIKVRKHDTNMGLVELDKVPKYMNGSDALLDDIQKGISYPEEALTKNIDGTVMVNVVIDKFGNVIKTSIYSSPNDLLNSAAMTAAKSLKKFEPHLEKGLVVSAQFILPVRFIL